MNEPVPEVEGDFIPLRMTFDHELYVVFVGEASQSVARVQVNDHWCAIADGKWTSPPIPYYPGMEVAAKLINGKGETREIRTILPGPDALGPIFGPDWTPFAPLK